MLRQVKHYRATRSALESWGWFHIEVDTIYIPFRCAQLVCNIEVASDTELYRDYPDAGAGTCKLF